MNLVYAARIFQGLSLWSRVDFIVARNPALPPESDIPPDPPKVPKGKKRGRDDEAVQEKPVRVLKR
jgi:hypothetical protein